MLKQVATQKQHFNVLPQQIQLLKVFHLNTLELQQRIQEELNDNPLLEEEVNEEDKLPEESSKEDVQEYQDEEENTHDKERSPAITARANSGGRVLCFRRRLEFSFCCLHDRRRRSIERGVEISLLKCRP